MPYRAYGVNSYLSPLTCHLSPVTSHLSPLPFHGTGS